MGICAECSKKPECKRMCKQAKAYLAEIEEEWEERPSVYMYGEEMRVFDSRNGKDKALYTPQELIILNAINMQKSRKEIAEFLGISDSTMRVHIKNLKDKAFRKRA